jgi:hypothetical protein
MSLFDLLTETAIADTDLLRKNDSIGDVFSTSREVDFDFESPDMERATDFSEFVTGKSYGRTKINDLGTDGIQILVFIDMPITQHLICSVSGFMLCLSRLFLIEYKGWGSIIQKESN